MSIRGIYNELMDKYYNYYCSVYYEFILEAIKNTLQDLRNVQDKDIDMIHKHIRENYI